MDRSEVLKLISYVYTKNSNGVTVKSETTRNVFVKVDSVTRSEWFEGNRSGLIPEYRFTMFAPDYDNEEAVEYKGVKYYIYRTYIQKNDTIELYVKRLSGK